MTTVKSIFNEISSLNAKTNTFSSLGSVVSDMAQQIRDDFAREILNSLPGDSLAHKIVSQNDRFSEKQLWVVAYELMKNAEYCTALEAKENQRNSEAKAKQAKSNAKLAANKEASADVLAQIKQAGRLLKDYYAWLKKSNFKKEFFNKKYSQNSVDAFLAI